MPGGPVRRVVPLAPDVTELAFALGAGSLVEAVPAAADHPPEVKGLRQVSQNEVEAILSLRPDLVLATTAGNDARVIGRLRELGTRVFTTDVTSFDRLAQACRLVGRALDRPDEGRRLAEDIETRCALIRARAAALPRRTALYVVWWDPLIVGAPGTFHDDLLKRAALVNLAPTGGGRYPRVDPELLLDPRLDFVVSPDEKDLRDGFARITRSPAGERLASGTVRALWLPADQASRPGPRLPEALEALIADREAAEGPVSGVRGQGPRVGGQGLGPSSSAAETAPQPKGRFR